MGRFRAWRNWEIGQGHLDPVPQHVRVIETVEEYVLYRCDKCERVFPTSELCLDHIEFAHVEAGTAIKETRSRVKRTVEELPDVNS